MSEIFEDLLPTHLDQATVLWLAIGGAVAAFVLFLALQWLLTSLRTPVPEAVPPETTLLDEYKSRMAPRGFGARVDSSFAELVTSTGLGLTVEQALGWVVLAGAVGAVGLYLARPDPALAMVGLALGVGLAFVALVSYQRQQRWRVREQLPDVINMLARSARAGLSMERALYLLGQEHKMVLAPDFRLCSARIELGMPAVMALDRMAQRLNILEFDGLVAVVGLHQYSGGNLPVLLERLATSTRDHNQFRSYLRTATALARTAAMCIGLVTPVALLAYAVFQPEFCLNFFRSTFGWTVVALAIILDFVGGVWIYYLLRIEA